MKTRLDPVVRFRQQKEDRALQGLARATEDAGQAHAKLTHAQQQAAHDGRSCGSAADWAMAEAARERALGEVKRARDQFEKTTSAVEVARTAWRMEHRQTEVVKRVADSRRSDAREAQARRDTRELDELGAMLFWRKPA